jgi:hypothetical protein
MVLLPRKERRVVEEQKEEEEEKEVPRGRIELKHGNILFLQLIINIIHLLS